MLEHYQLWMGGQADLERRYVRQTMSTVQVYWQAWRNNYILPATHSERMNGLQIQGLDFFVEMNSIKLQI